MSKLARREWNLLLLIAVGALAVRLILMQLRGDYIVYDEGYYVLLARSLREGGGFSLNGLPQVALSPLQPALVAAASVLGIGDLLASRTLAAVAGAALVFPVALLAFRVAGERAALLAAALTGAAPALMSFVPFFPGRSWNLYFGSEPLFLLLAFVALALGERAIEGGRMGSWALCGAACALAFLSRPEGVVLGATLALVLVARLAASRARPRAWMGPVVAVLVAVVLTSPYLLHLRRSLGRWALSGRVQAAAAPSGPVSAAASTSRGGSVLDRFIWEGDHEALQAELYGLRPDGRFMASQYWGVAPLPGPDPGLAAPRRDATTTEPAEVPSSRLRSLARGLGAVMPWWFAALGLAGFVLLWRRAGEMLWTIPAAVTALAPALLVYVEPRVLLSLVPLGAVGVALLWESASRAMTRSAGADRWAVAVAVGLVAITVAPLVRDARAAVPGDAPLQRVASAQRAVGTYLEEHLPERALVMSWHPAVAVYAQRGWRVLPAEPMERIVPYARSQGVSALVLSRFHYSPLSNPPRSFTVVMLDSVAGPAVTDGAIELQQIDATPLLFVGRLAPARSR